jgi:flavin reductase
MELARRFSSAEGRARRFEGCAWVPLATGAPALPSALASFDCEITNLISVHSHSIFIGAVRDMRLWRDEIDALLYFDGHYEVLSSGAA